MSVMSWIGLVLSTHVFDTFRRPTRGVLNMEHLWQHAATVSRPSWASDCMRPNSSR